MTEVHELEAQLAVDANSVFDGVLDLNTTMVSLGAQWDKLMELRSRLLIMHGVPAHKARPPGKGVQPPAAASFPPPAMMKAWQTAQFAEGSSPDGDFKSKLQFAVTKRAKRTLTKGELIYTHTPDESSKPALYTATVHGTSEGLLKQPYSSSEPVSGKRAAEHAAAKVALEAEFGFVFDGKVPATPAPPAEAGKDPRTRLTNGAHLLLGRPLAKGEVVYATRPAEPSEGKGFVCTSSIPAHDPSASWQGAPAESVKQAEMNAAEAALEALAKTIAALEVERAEKRRLKDQEAFAKKRAKREAAAGTGPDANTGSGAALS
eukprot:CAMPEP_0198547222 /NCGR_PEP_ID=MMETSP1462-20131121/67437_1 /TAXON_ID=1333877 /ORGANISM="Brandtodinium nutriculum, Strain RCC3387" /LENGTH=318 /DNA_ID=CAMNT_0044277699 /DNA_START=69 /DNA_END=1025 /DNA_ORIENTATION=-